MAIVETYTYSRANTSVDFPYDALASQFDAEVKPSIQSYIDSGAYTRTSPLSDDGLKQSKIETYADVATYSAVRNAIDGNSAYKKAFIAKTAENNISFVSSAMTGIDQAFTITTTYTTHENFDKTNLIQYLYQGGFRKPESTRPLEDGYGTVVVHKYENAADYNSNKFMDSTILGGLLTDGVIKTILVELT